MKLDLKELFAKCLVKVNEQLSIDAENVYNIFASKHVACFHSSVLECFKMSHNVYGDEQGFDYFKVLIAEIGYKAN